ncbi:MAG: hypothetical protein HC851_11375 [Acaryochloris sp. RU_4_1]|nr:hypothetical protein [Acaryochloris sp. RU_4_1]NJR55292.1 hypothetical protein [Acaryochloris sp. CRU_2_0]
MAREVLFSDVVTGLGLLLGVQVEAGGGFYGEAIWVGWWVKGMGCAPSKCGNVKLETVELNE